MRNGVNVQRCKDLFETKLYDDPKVSAKKNFFGINLEEHNDLQQHPPPKNIIRNILILSHFYEAAKTAQYIHKRIM